jgi:hypothetical protein
MGQARRSRYVSPRKNGKRRVPIGSDVLQHGEWTDYVSQRGPRRIRIVSVRRVQPDERKLARVLLDIARRMHQDHEGR